MRVAKLELSLELECWVDKLSPAQMAAYEKVAAEHNAIKSSLKKALTTNEGKELFNGDVFQAYSFKGKVLQELKEATLPPKKPAKDASTDADTTNTRSSRKRPSNFVYLESTDEDADEDLPLAKRLALPPSKKPVPASNSNRKSVGMSKSKQFSGKNSPQLSSKFAHKSSSGKSSSDKSAADNSTPTFRPSEVNSVGGLVIGNEKDTVDKDKLQGKTYPSLVVLAKPWLRVKDMSATRGKLDSKVKLVLMLTPNKFTEWLLQEGLLKSEQKCANHRNSELKLGVYSDASKFPYTGGYVWISECCPLRFVSVFQGSIFEGAPHPPSCILKLIYHWSCQTIIQNVVQWVKVDNVYIKSVYTWLRAVCTMAVHQKIKKLGGADKYVEVGVISLGTSSQDGAQRQVKVEVLGIYDHAEKMIRLRAVEPLTAADRNYKKRFQTILEPLQRWAHKDSIIVIDLTVDKSTIHQMGFKHVVQAAVQDSTAKHTNALVMDYLRRIVPRMFQNTLSLLSRQMIQQFLDELVWREQFGTYALQAFNNITGHIAEQTRMNTKETLTQRLYQVATNPFKDWSNVPVISKETPPNTTPKRLKNLINDADYTQPKLTPKPEKKIKAEVEKLRTRSPLPAYRTTRPRGKQSEEHVPHSKKTVSNKHSLVSIQKHSNASKNAMDIKGKGKQAAQYLKESIKSKSALKNKDAAKSKDGAKAKESVKFKEHKKEEDDLQGIEVLYYGVRDGLNDYYENYPNNSDSSAELRCPTCTTTQTFTTNTQLQKHLYTHVDLEGSCKDGQSQCEYCLLKFADDQELADHEKNTHFTETRGEITYNCLICLQSFPNSLYQLTLHLQKMHNLLELPFYCQACGYRTSTQRDIMRHFNEDHHQHNFLLCPFCLDIYHFSYKGVLKINHIELFYMHLREHAVKAQQKASLRCNKCVLNFIDKGALKYHNYNNHISWFKNNNNIRPLLPNALLIPLPKVRSHHREPLQFIVHEKLSEFFAFIEGSICAECNSEIINEEHYPALMKCSKCNYKTCCERAIYSHTSNCSGATESRFMLELPLAQEMHCICGFSTALGNKMAEHLGSCGQKSAYPSLEVAIENTVKRNMLDMLGLMRRDGETTVENNDTPKDTTADTESVADVDANAADDDDDDAAAADDDDAAVEDDDDTAAADDDDAAAADDDDNDDSADDDGADDDDNDTTANGADGGDDDGTNDTSVQEPIPYGELEAAPVAEDVASSSNTDYTQLQNAVVQQSTYQEPMDYAEPTNVLNTGEIDMPLIGDLSDPNPTVTPAQYLGEVHTPMFDAMAAAEQQHYHQLIDQPPTAQ